MKQLEYRVNADKYRKIQTKVIEKTISQIDKLLGKKGKISVEGLELNLRGDSNEDLVKIKIFGNFSKGKENYIREIMDTFMSGIEN